MSVDWRPVVDLSWDRMHKITYRTTCLTQKPPTDMKRDPVIKKYKYEPWFFFKFKFHDIKCLTQMDGGDRNDENSSLK